jgi:hypothetical protein
MDIKDAENDRAQNRPEILKCEDATSFLAGDLWRSTLRREREDDLAGRSRR